MQSTMLWPVEKPPFHVYHEIQLAQGLLPQTLKLPPQNFSQMQFKIMA